MKKIFIFVVLVLVVLLLVRSSRDEIREEPIIQDNVVKEGYKLVDRDRYSFQVPNEWIESSIMDFEGCRWDGVSNDGGDGHRQSGEIGIYEKSCFDLSKSLGKREVAEKDGFYIIAYYDRITGTTEEEETETKSVHQVIVETFSLK